MLAIGIRSKISYSTWNVDGGGTRKKCASGVYGTLSLAYRLGKGFMHQRVTINRIGVIIHQPSILYRFFEVSKGN